jgi:HSP20 family protein
MTNTIAKRQNGNENVSFGNVVDNIFQNSLKRFFDDNFWDIDPVTGSGSVPVNIREKEDQYEVDIVAPGCRKEDFNISMKGNMLTISFNHKEENNQGDQKASWVRNEYMQRSFSRSFTLDETVDVNKIQATYTDGILRIVLGKHEKATPVSRTIEIK